MSSRRAPILLSPHHDDETLFCAFTAIREQAHIITVLRSDLQEQRGNAVTDAIRQLEASKAAVELGCTVEFWSYSDANPDWLGVTDRLKELALDPDARVYAPAVEEGGHDHHNAIGGIARFVFKDRVTHYLTYTNGRDRSRSDRPVPFEPGWISQKLRALAHYESQIKLWPHHFLAPQTEYYA